MKLKDFHYRFIADSTIQFDAIIYKVKYIQEDSTIIINIIRIQGSNIIFLNICADLYCKMHSSKYKITINMN